MSELKFQALFENALDALVIADDQGRYLEVNPAACELFGLPRSQLLGRKVDEFGTPVGIGDTQQAWSLFREQGKQKGEFILRRSDGQLRTLEYNAVADFLPGQHLSVLRDVTERKTAELERESLLASERTARAQADEAGRLRERLLGILGHDLRNPLSAIILAGKLLLRSTQLVAADRRRVERMLTSSERMSRLISQLLDFSQARIGGGLTVRRVETNLQLLCQEAIDELQMVTPDRNILLEAQAGEIIGQWDPDRLLEVLSNLVGNAIQHSDPISPVKVRVGSNENHAWIEIHNRGEPIPLELLPEIFDPFRRGPQEAMSGSVGLGLYISQQIVLAHHGEIEVASERETGTLFRVRLPLRGPTSQ